MKFLPDVADCPSILNEFREKQRRTKVEYYAYLNLTIHQSQRNCEKIDQFVCCPQDPQLEQEAIPAIFSGSVNAELNPPECGRPTNLDGNRVLGGSNAPVGAWPWMALYGKGTSANPKFTCGGSIISKRHVLTAAHCVLDGTTKLFSALNVHEDF